MSFGEENKQLGVLLAGYLEKQNPYGKVFRRRFIVLTKEAFHWFKVNNKQTRNFLFFLFLSQPFFLLSFFLLFFLKNYYI